MSEHQIVKFRAIDRPLTDKQLRFMERQSSRAEFTKWEFEVEYDYASFRGNVNEMLRNGYDIFLNYSNYGIREIRLRLPYGLPFAKSKWSQYVSNEGLKWTADKSGTAGILTLDPFIEEAYDPIWEFDDYLDAAMKLREMLIVGDLRALYVLWLCNVMSSGCFDEDLKEPPVPHGLGALESEVADLFDFFDSDPLLIDAAAKGIPRFEVQDSQHDLADAWVLNLDVSQKDEIIKRLLNEDPFDLKAELLSKVRKGRQSVTWPVEPPARTVAQLLESCEVLRQRENEKRKKQAAAKAKREAAKAERERQARLSDMRASPDKWLKNATNLVESRGNDNYQEAAGILADLHDALSGEDNGSMARKHAVYLARKYPTLTKLKSYLRKRGLLE